MVAALPVILDMPEHIYQPLFGRIEGRDRAPKEGTSEANEPPTVVAVNVSVTFPRYPAVTHDNPPSYYSAAAPLFLPIGGDKQVNAGGGDIGSDMGGR